MSDPLAPVGEGDTAVPDDLRDQLIPSYIATLAELHAAEEENIAAATFRRRPTTDQLLDDLYLRGLHRSMFDRVWRWAAGTAATTSTSEASTGLRFPEHEGPGQRPGPSSFGRRSSGSRRPAA